MASAEEKAQRDDDIEAIEDDTMTWNGGDYTGVFTELTTSDTPEIGGFERDYEASFYVRTGQFSGTRPKVGDTVTVNTKTYLIRSVHSYPDDVALELTLTAPHGG